MNHQWAQFSHHDTLAWKLTDDDFFNVFTILLCKCIVITIFAGNKKPPIKDGLITDLCF